MSKHRLKIHITASPKIRLTVKFLMLTAGAAGLLLVGVFIFMSGLLTKPENTSGAPGMHGAKTVSSTNVKVNEFTTLTANASSGANSLTVASSTLNSNGRFSGNMVAGELIMIAQMQGATMTTTSAGMYSVGAQNTTASTNSPYHRGTDNEGRVQYLFTAAELSAAGLSSGNITSLEFDVSTLGAGTITNWTVGMATTGSSSLSSTFKTTALTTVFSADVTPVLGWNANNFTTPFNWDGTSNVFVQICFDAPGNTNTTAVEQTNISNMCTYYNGASACSHLTGTVINTRPVVMFGQSVNNQTWGTISAYNNAGNFEFAVVNSITDATHIKIVGTLKNSYTSSGKVQIVRVPRYSSLTINSGASVTTDAWNGSTGGILAMEVNGAATINGTIDVTGLGFRGGAVDNNTTTPGNHYTSASINNYDGSEKGEGIGGSQTDYDSKGGRYARGAPANGGGGGNSHNSGGGGGANGASVGIWDGLGNPSTSTPSWSTAWNFESASFASHTSPGGGRGGYTWSQNIQNPLSVIPGNSLWGGDNRNNVGGYGGRPLTYTATKLFMGGGGGAGDGNNGIATAGGDGGGIVYLITSGSVNGSGTINANGDPAATSTGPAPKDAMGGGGGGGAIFIYRTTGTLSSSIKLNAKGGDGGDQNDTGTATGEVEGPGGGGGGGYISYTTPGTPTVSVAGGLFGTVNTSIMSTFTPNGATSGAGGLTATNPSSPYTTYVALPITLTNFTGTLTSENKVALSWATAAEINLDYFTVEKSADGITFSDLTTVPGSGNTSTSNSYSYTDAQPYKGTTYYRLKETDFNDQSQSFNTIAVKTLSENVEAGTIHVSPNPFYKSFDAVFNNDVSELLQVQLINMNGAVVFTDQIMAQEGINSYHFAAPANFKQAIYILKISTSGKVKFATKIICGAE